MKKRTKFRSSVVFAVFFGVILAGSIAVPTTQAATLAELQAQIQNIIAQINQIQLALTQRAIVGPSAPCTTNLTRNLSIGMTGEDVRALQQFLNRDVNTRVAVSGIGSQGNESAYFGPLTQQAVLRFQEKYRSDVLTPWGLISGTGIADLSTRTKIHALCGAMNIPKPAEVTLPPVTPVTPSAAPAKVVGTEGDLRVTRGSEHTGTLNLNETDDIYAVGVKAVDSAIIIERMDFRFDKRPWRYIKSFSLYHNEKRVTTMASEESAFSTVESEYRLRFSNLSEVVKEGDKDTFVLRATGLNALSSSRVNDTLSVYIPQSGIRARDTANLITNAPDSNLDPRTFDFKSTEQDGEIIVTRSSGSPESGVIQVKSNATTRNETVLIAQVKAKESDIRLRDVYVKVDSSNTDVSKVVRRLSLVADNKTFATESVIKNGGSAITATDEDGSSYTLIGANEYYVHYTDFGDILIREDNSKEITLKAEFEAAKSSNYEIGTSVTFTIRAIKGENKYDEDVVAGNLNVGSNRTFYLYTDSLSSRSGSVSATSKGYLNRIGEFSVSFSITAFGNDIYVATDASRQTSTSTVGTGGVEYVILNGSRSLYTGGSASHAFDMRGVQESNGYYRINEGETRTATLSIALDNTGGIKDFYRAKLVLLRYRVGSPTGPEYEATTGLRDLETGVASLNN